MKKAIVYINQFFAGIGGEAAADQKPEFHDGVVGAAMALDGAMQNADVMHTIVCGDN